MNRLLWYLRGYCTVEIAGASPDWTLNRLAQRRVPFWDIQWLDEMRVRLCVFSRDLPVLRQTTIEAMCQLETEIQMGPWPALRKLLRPILLIGIGLTLCLLLVLPNYLLFFTVSGNETVPEEKILRTLEDLDIDFGVYGPDVHPKWIKDHVLNLLPQLQWITVTQNGCIAQVVVRERPETPKVIDRKGFANVIASRAGLITSQSVLAGQPLKQVGDIVVKGELLVSGIVDLERVFTMEYAQAEIFARTWYHTTAITPSTIIQKCDAGEPYHAVWIEFGKERIKIFGNSGISTATCDKMIDRKSLLLPGDYILPVSLLIETYVPYETQLVHLPSAQVEQWLLDSVQDGILSRAKAGEVLQCQQVCSEENGVYVLKSVHECREMIAETVEAKWNKEDVADD